MYLEAAALGDGAGAYEEILQADDAINGGGPRSKRVPKVSPYSKRTRALHADAARRMARREEMHQERQLDGCTFEPQLISKQSEKGGREGGVASLIAFKATKLKKLEESRKMVDPECTFKPRINERSSRLAHNSRLTNLSHLRPLITCKIP